MSKEKTVILALGAAASLLFAPFLVGSLKGKAQEENTMMNGIGPCANAEECQCAKEGKECRCKSGECKSSCGGEGLTERCGEVSAQGQ